MFDYVLVAYRHDLVLWVKGMVRKASWTLAREIKELFAYGLLFCTYTLTIYTNIFIALYRYSSNSSKFYYFFRNS